MSRRSNGGSGAHEKERSVGFENVGFEKITSVGFEKVDEKAGTCFYYVLAFFLFIC